MSEWKRIRDESPPEDEMCLLARRNDRGGWGIGLAYRNISGGWSCAYGESYSHYTHWKPIGHPPTDLG